MQTEQQGIAIPDLGKGETAKNSLAFLFMRWFLIVPAVIALAMIVPLYWGVNVLEAGDKVYSIFQLFTAPIMAILGYLFGQQSRQSP